MNSLLIVFFEISATEFFSVAGASGAGKTTAFDIITELTIPTRGTVQNVQDEDTGVVGCYFLNFGRD